MFKSLQIYDEHLGFCKFFDKIFEFFCKYAHIFEDFANFLLIFLQIYTENLLLCKFLGVFCAKNPPIDTKKGETYVPP